MEADTIRVCNNQIERERQSWFPAKQVIHSSGYGGCLELAVERFEALDHSRDAELEVALPERETHSAFIFVY